MSAWAWGGVALLGGGGALARFMLDEAIGSRAGRASSFPLGTFAVNVSGALLLGLLNGAGLTGEALTLAGAATLGSYTTFSTWMLESQRLAEDADSGGALLNILLSLTAGLAAAALGRAIGAHL
ncbi:MAG: fluoride efflux transporter CrcB [Solirubrobacteraceae bacterium]